MKVPSPSARRFRFGPFEIGSDEPVLRRQGELVPLPRRSVALLLALLDRPGRVVLKEELLRTVWPDVAVAENNLNQAVLALRRALGDSPESPRYLDTIPRVGYRFVGTVEVDEPEAAAVAAPAAAARRSLPAIAVLPFTSPVEASALAEGLVEGVTSALARRGGLVVRAAGAVRRSLAQVADPMEAGRRLDVDFVADGRVRSAGDRVSVSVELIRVVDGGLVWAGRAEPALSGLLAYEDELAAQLAAGVSPANGPQAASHVARPASSSTAYPLTLQGRQYANYLTAEGYEASQGCFRLAIEQDPTFAPAYAGLAYLNLQVTEILLSPGEAMTRARRAAEQALRLDPGLAEAHASLGTVRFMYDWDRESAEESFQAARACPGWAPVAHRLFGWFRALSGRFSEAFELFAAAADADPLSLERHLYETASFWLSRRWEEGLRATHAMLRLFPELWLGHVLEGRMLEGLGEPSKALASFERGASRPGSADEALGDLGRRRALSGDRKGARALLDELDRRALSRHVSAFHRAQVLLGLGEVEPFHEALETAVAERSWYVTWFHSVPFLDPVRKDVRFARIVESVGLWRGLEKETP